jgi:hypothetical protein
VTYEDCIYKHLFVESDIVEEDDGCDIREVWAVNAYWKGKPLAVWYPEYQQHCRYLFKLSVWDKTFLLKVEHDTDMPQCPREIRLWTRLSRYDSRYFAPIVAYNMAEDAASWVVQPFLNLRKSEPTRRQYDTISRLEYKYNITDLRLNSNWFIHNNKPIIVDYGL